MPMELHTQHDLMLPVRARPLKNVAQMVEQRIVSSLLSWSPVKFNADNAGFYDQAISDNHNNQRYQRAIKNNKQSTMNANGITCGILGYRFESGRASSVQLTRHVA